MIDVDEIHSGIVVQKMSERKAEMIELKPSGGHRVRLVFYAPTRGLIGYQGELLTDTRGTAIMNRLFHAYAPHKGDIAGRRNGVLISNDRARPSPTRMWKLEDRGPMMIEPGWKVYRGMIVGEHTRDNDLEINVLKGKQLTNIRTTSKDEAVRLTPPIRMSLEKALAYIEDDELVEVTPKSIRLRKKLLDANDRKKQERQEGTPKSPFDLGTPIAPAGGECCPHKRAAIPYGMASVAGESLCAPEPVDESNFARGVNQHRTRASSGARTAISRRRVSPRPHHRQTQADCAFARRRRCNRALLDASNPHR